MNPVALLGAFFGGVVGAATWTLIVYFTGYEMGYVAWLVGGLVGFGAVRLDGGGIFMGLCCSVICLGAMFLGKIGAVHATMAGVHEKMAATLTDDYYETMVGHASLFWLLPSSSYYEGFMVEHDYVDTSEVSAEQLAEFEAVVVPLLRRLHIEKLGVTAWRDAYVELYVDFKLSGRTIPGLIFAELDLVDMIFAFLGVLTTFGMLHNAGIMKRNRESALSY